MADGRKNNGGARKGAGRPPKADEVRKAEMMDSVGDSVEVWKALYKCAIDGDVSAQKYWLDQRFGKPTEKLNQTVEFSDFRITDVLKPRD